ncbi:MAG: CoA-binding protein [Candidatus Hodarchaeota archaeon]
MDDKPGSIDFQPLFYPKTYAVIGASTKSVGVRKYVVAHLNTGIKVFPVNKNPSLTELEGLPVYRSVLDIEEDIDFAVIGVPKQFVPEVMDDCDKKGVKFAVLFTSGFKESGNDDLDKIVQEKVQNSKITRYIGPNCLGVFHPRGKLSYWKGKMATENDAGNVSFIGQSGGHTGKTIGMLLSRGIKLSKVISIGNSIDLQPQDFLRYFQVDKYTSVVGLYLESTSDGKELMNALKDITPVKPVVLWKGGQGEVGFKATASHTGELAGEYKIWKAMCKQTGTILADDYSTLLNLLTMFSCGIPLPKSLNVAILASGGGACVELADVFEGGGFKIPELSDEVKQKIGEFIPDVNSSFRNPVDLGEYGYNPRYYIKALEILVRYAKNVDCIVHVRETTRLKNFAANFNLTPEEYEDFMIQGIFNIEQINKKGRNIPILFQEHMVSESIEGFQSHVSFREKLIPYGIPAFMNEIALMKAIKKMQEYRQYLEKI